MHEHVREELVDVEFGSHEEMQTQQVVQLNTYAAEYKSCGKHQDVNNQQVLRYRGDCTHVKCRIKVVLQSAKLRKISVTKIKNGPDSTFFHEFLHFFYFFV